MAKSKQTKRQSGFVQWQGDKALSIHKIAMQITRYDGAFFQQKRDHIHAAFTKEYAIYHLLFDTQAARELAAFNAQYRVDSLHGAGCFEIEQKIKIAILQRYNARCAKRQAK
ncbi:hypothetical protein QG083_05930 [Kingella kingae]|uniref:hypothetical protein n=1 Tax=Kingella kingae TaxID=504 RepID=UPI0013E01AE8|nr:hypothetical protein [Kingella kingae]MBD3614781.1 hypothetical protein [Kingella kingae]MBD3633142.1 hypothetical protein [Kingella kingae]MBD3660448.1 hypothetical protein [Kingella kingae]MDK4587073.1 hypothetical protein [Kingella kingae]MDK4605002.1 hypothetical protein [Kingella kingae]